MHLKKAYIVLIVIAVAIAACSGGGAGSTDTSQATTSNVQLSGTVAAPGGTIAFNGPTWKSRVLAWLVQDTAAAVAGTLPVGPGVGVNLIQIDTTGNQVGAVIAAGITDANGRYALNAPPTFVSGAQYVVRAVGSTGNMDAIVTDTAADIAVDPSTDATRQLVLAAATANSASLSSLSTAAIAEVQSEVDNLVRRLDVSTLGAVTATNLATAIRAEGESDEEVGNVVHSIAAGGIIDGRVVDRAGVGLSDIKVVARDYNNWVTRAETHTDGNGYYTMKAPPSPSQGYIVGAFNLSNNPTMSASEWYTAGGGTPVPSSADRVTVDGSAPTTINFVLDNGARLAGVVTTDNGVPLPGVLVLLRDANTGFPVTWMYSRSDGSYTLNVWPTRPYTLSARNNTTQAYGTATYNGPASGGTSVNGGAVLQDGGTIVRPGVGTSTVANFALQSGHKIAGCVTEPPAPTPTGADACAGAGSAVAGIAVRVYSNAADSTNGGFVESPRTNKNGRFRMWVKPGQYTVRARGQTQIQNVTSADAYLAFNAQVGRATLTVTSNGTTPVSQTKVQVYDYSNASTPIFKGFEVAQGDGSVEIYTDTPSNVQRVVFLVDGDQIGVGTVVYDGASPTSLSLNNGTDLTMSTTAGTTNLGTITLPPGYRLSGNISGGAGGMRTVQIRNGGTTAANVLANTRAQGDGSYGINVPAAANYYWRVCDPTPPAPGTCTAFTGPNTIPAADTTQNF